MVKKKTCHNKNGKQKKLLKIEFKNWDIEEITKVLPFFNGTKV